MALSRARRVALLGLPSLIFVLTLGGIELGVRLLLPRVESLDVFVTNPRQQAQFVDQNKVRVFEGDPLLFWRLLPNLRDVAWERTTVTTNAQGLRYHSFVGRKPPGGLRIVCLGDSVTFGFQVPRVHPERPTDFDRSARPYPALLEEWLRAANRGRTIEVVPLACPGYSSYQGLAWLRRDIARLEPDLVTACFGWNDICRRNVTDPQAMPGGWLSVSARAVVFRSQVLLRLHERLGRWGLGRRAPAEGWQLTMRVPRDEYVSHMIDIARLARDHGAKPVLLGPVYRDLHSHPPEGDDIAGHRAALAAAAANEGVAYLEFPELTEAAWPRNRPLFSEHIHPNDRGHRLMAEELLRFLAEQGLLGDLTVPASPEKTRS